MPKLLEATSAAVSAAVEQDCEVGGLNPSCRLHLPLTFDLPSGLTFALPGQFRTVLKHSCVQLLL